MLLAGLGRVGLEFGQGHLIELVGGVGRHPVDPPFASKTGFCREQGASAGQAMRPRPSAFTVQRRPQTWAGYKRKRRGSKK